MAEVKLANIKCPSCGAHVNVKEGETFVECAYCGDSFNITKKEPENNSAVSSVIRVEGSDSPSTMLAYVEEYFDSYNWSKFYLNSNIELDEFKTFKQSMMRKFPDDYRTWKALFLIEIKPLEKKLGQIKNLFDLIIKKFEKEDFDSYVYFDIFKSIIYSIRVKAYEITKICATYIEKAKKYGCSEEELQAMQKELASIDLEDIKQYYKYTSLEQLPEVRIKLAERQRKLVEKLLDEGIDAEEYYQQGLDYQEVGNKLEAIRCFEKILDYKDAKQRLDAIKSYVKIGEFRSISGNFYYFDENLELYKVTNKARGALISKVDDIYTNYGPTIFATTKIVKQTNDSDEEIIKKETLSSINLETKEIQPIKEFKKMSDSYYDFGEFILIEAVELKQKFPSMWKLNCKTKTIKKINLPKYEKIKFKWGNLLVIAPDKGSSHKTIILDAKNEIPYYFSYDISSLATLDENILFTINNRNEYNRNLYSAVLGKEGSEVLLEQNITGDIDVVNNKIYYYIVDNRDVRRLVTIDIDGSNRRELRPYVSDVLFELGGWLYYSVESKNSSGICKLNLENPNEKDDIVFDLRKYWGRHDGYLYYTNSTNELRRVRMDGSSDKLIAKYVKDVLSVTNDAIVFKSMDELEKVVQVNDALGNPKKIKTPPTDSIYYISLETFQMRKLAYNVAESVVLDNILYYTKSFLEVDVNEKRSPANIRSLLYCVKLGEYESELEAVIYGKKEEPKKKKGCYIATSVYGSYDCPEVWTLRRYRDNYLDKHWWGRLFIKFYYAVSPVLVKMFGKTKLFQKLWQKILNKKVAKLAKKGYENTPYNDKY